MKNKKLDKILNSNSKLDDILEFEEAICMISFLLWMFGNLLLQVLDLLKFGLEFIVNKNILPIICGISFLLIILTVFIRGAIEVIKEKNENK